MFVTKTTTTPSSGKTKRTVVPPMADPPETIILRSPGPVATCQPMPKGVLPPSEVSLAVRYPAVELGRRRRYLGNNSPGRQNADEGEKRDAGREDVPLRRLRFQPRPPDHSSARKSL